MKVNLPCVTPAMRHFPARTAEDGVALLEQPDTLESDAYDVYSHEPLAFGRASLQVQQLRYARVQSRENGSDVEKKPWGSAEIHRLRWSTRGAFRTAPRSQCCHRSARGS